MDDQTARAALKRHWDASDANDFSVEHEIYHEDAMLDYPQSGERIHGRHNIQESRFVQPNSVKDWWRMKRNISPIDLTLHLRVRILSSGSAKWRPKPEHPASA
jgi:hypothetical protein